MDLSLKVKLKFLLLSLKIVWDNWPSKKILLRVFFIISFKFFQKLIRKLIIEILYFGSAFNWISSSNNEICFILFYH